MAKKNALISVAHNPETNVLTFTVGEGAGSFDVPISALSDEIRNRATIHGLVQKVSDAAAMPKSELPKDKAKAAKVKFDAMSNVANRLANGEWSARRGDGSGAVAGVIFRAFAEYVANMAKSRKKPIPDEEVIRAVYDAKSRSEQLALRNVPEIATIIERIKSERGPTVTVDTDALLGDLGI